MKNENEKQTRVKDAKETKTKTKKQNELNVKKNKYTFIVKVETEREYNAEELHDIYNLFIEGLSIEPVTDVKVKLMREAE